MKKGLSLSSLGSCFPPLPLHSQGCLLFPVSFSWASQEQGVEIPGGGGLWARGGEGGGSSACLESPGAEQASARKGKPSCPPVGALGRHSPSGPRSHSSSPASHRTFPLGHRYSDGFWCRLERVPPCSASGGERTGRHHSAPHLRPRASALIGLCLVCDQRVGE